MLGVLNAALPFWLIAWGEQHIDSGLAAVVQASVPIFNALILLRVIPHERLSTTRASGSRSGSSASPSSPGSIRAAAGGRSPARSRSSLSSLSYAGAGVYGQLAVSGTAGPVLAAGSMLVGGLILLPFALFQLPASAPELEATASLLALTLLGTALAQLILFRMLALHGSARLSLVTYLMPGFALVYGALILDEELTALDARRPRADPRRRRARFGRRATAAARSGRRPAVTVAIRAAGPADLEFLVELYADEDVRPFLAAAGSYDRDGIAAKVAQDPETGGLLVVELDGEPAGAMGWELANRAQPDRPRQRPRRAPALPRPPGGRRRRAPAAAPPDPGARLPPDRARDLRLQRACAAARGARGLHP